MNNNTLAEFVEDGFYDGVVFSSSTVITSDGCLNYIVDSVNKEHGELDVVPVCDGALKNYKVGLFYCLHSTDIARN